jgi:nucleoside-diphosphate-sugar epimerase
MQTAVIGAGFIGTRVLKLLGADSGVAFSRSELPGLPSHRLDLDLDLDISVLARLPRRILYTVPPSQTSADDARLARLLAALEDPPERIVYLSTSGVYGNLAAASATETSPPAPLTPRARRRLAAEELLQSWCTLHETFSRYERIAALNPAPITCSCCSSCSCSYSSSCSRRLPVPKTLKHLLVIHFNRTAVGQE